MRWIMTLVQKLHALGKTCWIHLFCFVVRIHHDYTLQNLWFRCLLSLISIAMLLYFCLYTKVVWLLRDMTNPFIKWNMKNHVVGLQLLRKMENLKDWSCCFRMEHLKSGNFYLPLCLPCQNNTRENGAAGKALTLSSHSYVFDGILIIPLLLRKHIKLALLILNDRWWYLFLAGLYQT